MGGITRIRQPTPAISGAPSGASASPGALHASPTTRVGATAKGPIDTVAVGGGSAGPETTTAPTLGAVLDALCREDAAPLLGELSAHLGSLGFPLDARLMKWAHDPRAQEVLLGWARDAGLSATELDLTSWERSVQRYHAAQNSPYAVDLFEPPLDLPPEPPDPFDVRLALHLVDLAGGVGRAGRPRPGEAADSPRLMGPLRRALPQLLVGILAAWTDDAGRLSVAAARRALGPGAAATLDALVRLVADRPTQSVARSDKYSGFRPSDRALRRLGARQVVDPQRAPVVATLGETVAAQHTFAGWRLAAIQHLLPSTSLLLEGLAGGGVPRQRSVVLGKRYSTDPDTLIYLHSRGWHAPMELTKPGRLDNGRPLVDAPNLPKDLGDDPLTIQAFVELRRLLAGEKPGGPRRILLLDDGGRFVDLLHRYFPAYLDACAAVEQTDHGVQVIERMEKAGYPLQIPVINVARSDVKKLVEAALIGEKVAASIELHLLELGNLAPTHNEATVIGYGAVGKATADSLRRRGYRVNVYDIDPAKMEAAERDGCVPMQREAALRRAHLLISATGRVTVRPRDYDLLPDGAILANAGSGYAEIGAEELRHMDAAGSDRAVDAAAKKGYRGLAALLLSQRQTSPFPDPERHPGADGVLTSRFHGKPIRLAPGSRHRVLQSANGARRLMLCGGGVVNLHSEIPPEFIQLTLGLLFAACIQATHQQEPGLIDLDGAAQQRVQQQTEDDLASLGRSLMEPDYRGLIGLAPP